MTPFRRFLQRTAERLLGTHYEGPAAPGRLRAMVIDFANTHREATRAEWAEYAVGLVEEAYRTGWTRGFEHAERTYDWQPDVPPEELADMLDPEWRDPRRGIVVLADGELRVLGDDPEADIAPPFDPLAR